VDNLKAAHKIKIWRIAKKRAVRIGYESLTVVNLSPLNNQLIDLKTKTAEHKPKSG
jgi:hypothetical protein